MYKTEWSSTAEIKQAIEYFRKWMNLCAKVYDYDFQHPDVLITSQFLDHALNIYERLKRILYRKL